MLSPKNRQKRLDIQAGPVDSKILIGQYFYGPFIAINNENKAAYLNSRS